DLFNNAVRVRQNVVVPKPQYAPAFLFEVGSTPAVGLAIRMLAAISLDDQTMLGASEIDDESADRILPAEPIPLQTAVAQRRPEPPLGVCGGSPQVTCILVRHRYGSKPSPGFGLRPQPPSPAVRERGF